MKQSMGHSWGSAGQNGALIHRTGGCHGEAKGKAKGCGLGAGECPRVAAWCPKSAPQWVYDGLGYHLTVCFIWCA